MNDKNLFPEIDTSYWKLDDKAWVAERKANWEKIEKYYSGGLEKSKKGMNILKRYYLKGDMPDFRALRDWDNVERHLDLYSFIWLHPSRNFEVLNGLRNAYISCEDVLNNDIHRGILHLICVGFLYPSTNTTDDVVSIFNSGCTNKMMFEIAIGDFSEPNLRENGKKNPELPKFTYCGYSSVHTVGQWLCVSKPGVLAEHCLLQFDCFLDYIYLCCRQDSYFIKRLEKGLEPSIKKALFRIHRFDCEKEGDTARSRCVFKIKKLFDEREFHPQFKQIWNEVKTDTSDVKGLWRL